MGSPKASGPEAGAGSCRRIEGKRIKGGLGFAGRGRCWGSRLGLGPHLAVARLAGSRRLTPLLSRMQDPIVVFGVLVIVLCRDSIAGGGRIPG